MTVTCIWIRTAAPNKGNNSDEPSINLLLILKNIPYKGKHSCQQGRAILVLRIPKTHNSLKQKMLPKVHKYNLMNLNYNKQVKTA